MSKSDKMLSEMTKEELQEEMDDLKQKGIELFENGDYSEAMVLRTRWYLAASYMMDPAEIEIGTVYFIEGEPGKLFTASYIDGVMAHGSLANSPMDAAYPIAMLTEEPPVD